MDLFRRFIRDERGITAIEYALIATLVGITVVVWATLVGTKLNGTFAAIAGTLFTG
jgi:pilus assembly protein Flp/PilA